MRNHMQRLAATIAILASCAAVMIVSAGPSNATSQSQVAFATAGSGKAEIAVSFSTTLTKQSTVGGYTVTDIIYCGGYVTYPYIQGGAIRVDSHADCSAPVDNIYLLAAIYLSNGANMAERAKNVPGAMVADQFAVSGCLGITLDYIGFGKAIFTKLGYANSPLELAGQTPVVTIFC